MDPINRRRPAAHSAGAARAVQLVAGEYRVTVNPVDGSMVEALHPGERPTNPERHPGAGSAGAAARPGVPAPPPGATGPALPFLDRDEDRDRLVRLLARGRSVRVTGPAGSGRTTLLDAVAADCADLAPDGVIRLSGHRRTPTDLLYELYAAAFDASGLRPDRPQLLALLQEIGAVVVLDDLEFGGAGLDELLDATPECAFLISALPQAPAPSSVAHVEEVFLTGIGRPASQKLLAAAARRPLTEDETTWASDVWFESEGLPLRFVQAGALLRQRDELRAAAAESGGAAEEPLPTLAVSAAPAELLASRASGQARSALRFAVALGGVCPHPAHLPALAGDQHADTALAELVALGLTTVVGGRYGLAPGVTAQLAEAGYAQTPEGADPPVLTAAQHYAWWAGHASVTPSRIAEEADAILASLEALAGSPTPGHAAAAVLLARTAAPAFAAAQAWTVWEKTLRLGQQAARLAGEVGQEAYFHHELGILALCTGRLDRALAELEASVALRGAISDRGGELVGRRALALVADRGGFELPGMPGPGDEPGLYAPAAAVPEPGPELGAEPREEPLPVPEGPTIMLGQVRATGDDAYPAYGASEEPSRRTVGALPAKRRNLVAAAAGALAVAVLGTFVTITAIGGEENDKPASQVKVDKSASEEGESGLTPEEESSGSRSPARDGSQPGTSTDSPSPSSSNSDDESESPSDDPSESESDGGTTTGGGSTDGGSSTDGGTTGGSSTGGPTTGGPTGGTTDGGTTDGGTTDGGTTDGGTTDGGTTDGGTTDGGTTTGTTDGGTTDGGTTTGTAAGGTTP
ncbi:ATP-binding protein [Streptomyces sp. A7024]|uniref:ATP-binding protein n=1 Tax=Streptomyces coryli TaxID=1128680 RepID=A0A6G4UDB8_9ACTN|nr:ATP-binding protein [Streptomyces coryli]NGN69666.1 ATP-binding protein [Streptomyces coryli]